MDIKVCSDCGLELPLAKFKHRKLRSGNIGYRSRCSTCHSKYQRGLPSYNSEEARARRAEAAKEYRSSRTNKDRKNETLRRHRVKLRDAAVSAYGGKCSCCNESERLFLTIDHVNNDGAEHRKSVPAGDAFYRWLRDREYPEGFQILCWNCNSGRHLNGGVCPHEANLSL